MTRKQRGASPTHFSAVDLAQYELARSRLENARLMCQLAELRLQQELARHAGSVAALKNERGNALRSVEILAKSIATLQADLGVRYAVAMDKISYDDCTGEIVKHGE
jgi:hypothetical protein